MIEILLLTLLVAIPVSFALGLALLIYGLTVASIRLFSRRQ